MTQDFLEDYKTWENYNENYKNEKIKSMFKVLFEHLKSYDEHILNVDKRKYGLRDNMYEHFTNSYKVFYFCLTNVQFLKRFQLDYFFSKLSFNEKNEFTHDSSTFTIYRLYMKDSLNLKISDLQIDLFD